MRGGERKDTSLRNDRFGLPAGGVQRESSHLLKLKLKISCEVTAVEYKKIAYAWNQFANIKSNKKGYKLISN